MTVTITLTIKKTLPDGRIAYLSPLVFGGQIAVGFAEDEDRFFDDVWHYQDMHDALDAFQVWDGTGEPVGWYRNPKTKRRRPDGDPAKEYIAE